MLARTATVLFCTYGLLASGLQAGDAGKENKMEIRSGGNLIRKESTGARAESGTSASVQISAQADADLPPLTISAPALLQEKVSAGRKAQAKSATEGDGDPEIAAFAGEKCQNLLRKVNILLKEGKSLGEDIESFRANFDLVTLKEGVKNGEVWTVDDQRSILEDCFDIGHVENLEEHLFTCDAADCGAANSEPLFQGDVVLPENQHSSFIEQGSSFKVQSIKQRRTESDAAVNVPYCFADGTEQSAVHAFENAVKHYQEQVHCLTFQRVERGTDGKCEISPAILVGSQHPGCWSFLGQANGQLVWGQEASLLEGVSWGTKGHADGMLKVNIGDGCESMGMAAHQLGHALGMVHEMWRADRDDYIDVYPEHVAFAERADIMKEGEGVAKTAFDFLSLMMWSQNAFSEDGNVTITPRREPLLGHYFGQRMGLSQLDVEHLGDMYSCSASHLKPISRTKNVAASFLEGKGLTLDDSCQDHNYTGVQYTDGSGVMQFLSCSDISHQCESGDPVVMERLEKVCPISCIQCFPAPAWMIEIAKHTTETTTAPWQEFVHVPVTRCEDSEKTGIRFTGKSQEADCKDLYHYCSGHPHSFNVQSVCPKTCGKCELTAERAPEIAYVLNHSNCKDHTADEKPVFTLAGSHADCEQLKDYCKGHPHSKMVSAKCGQTCGNCVNEETANEEASIIAHAFELTTTVKWGTDQEVRDANKEDCSRRRRWGFCNTRRRDNHIVGW